MNYIVNPTQNPLDRSQLYEGRTVCYSNVLSHPNNVGILKASRDNATAGVWEATINNTLCYFDKNGYLLDEKGVVITGSGAQRLYGVVVSDDLDIDDSQSTTRGSGTVTITSLMAKDHFAIAAMQSIINTIPNTLAMDDATIVLVATKAYKIAQAMLQVGSLARELDSSEGSSGGSPGTVDVDNLNSNEEKLLNNIYKALEALNSKQDNVVTKLNEIKVQDAAKFTTGIKVDNPTDDEFNVNGAGGGSTIAPEDLKEICENNLNWNSLPNGDLVSIVGFQLKNGNRIPAENSIEKLMKLLEAQEIISSNNSAWYWLRKSPDGNVTITDITTFLTAYSTNIFDNQKTKIRPNIKAAIIKAFDQLATDNSNISVGGVANVISNLSNTTDSDWS